MGDRAFRREAHLVRFVDGQVVEDVVDHDRICKSLDQVTQRGEVEVQNDVLSRHRIEGRDNRDSPNRARRRFPRIDEVHRMTGAGEGLQKKLGPLPHDIPLRPRGEIHHRTQCPGSWSRAARPTGRERSHVLGSGDDLDETAQRGWQPGSKKPDGSPHHAL